MHGGARGKKQKKAEKRLRLASKKEMTYILDHLRSVDVAVTCVSAASSS